MDLDLLSVTMKFPEVNYTNIVPKNFSPASKSIAVDLDLMTFEFSVNVEYKVLAKFHVNCRCTKMSLMGMIVQYRELILVPLVSRKVTNKIQKMSLFFTQI